MGVRIELEVCHVHGVSLGNICLKGKAKVLVSRYLGLRKYSALFRSTWERGHHLSAEVTSKS